jgi:hypothetical protein
VYIRNEMGAYAPFRSYLTTYQGRVASAEEVEQGEATAVATYLCQCLFGHLQNALANKRRHMKRDYAGDQAPLMGAAVLAHGIHTWAVADAKTPGRQFTHSFIQLTSPEQSARNLSVNRSSKHQTISGYPTLGTRQPSRHCPAPTERPIACKQSSSLAETRQA